MGRTYVRCDDNGTLDVEYTNIMVPRCHSAANSGRHNTLQQNRRDLQFEADRVNRTAVWRILSEPVLFHSFPNCVYFHDHRNRVKTTPWLVVRIRATAPWSVRRFLEYVWIPTLAKVQRSIKNTQQLNASLDSRLVLSVNRSNSELR